MIIGIGCDIVEHEITKSLNWEKDISIRNRVFSEKEIDTYFSFNDLQFLSGRFAAKEALLKCLGSGMRDGISLPDIQILRLLDGKPLVELTGEVKKISDRMGIDLWHISISHCTNYSIAIVVAEKIWSFYR